VGNPLWKASMQKEYDSLLENQTWNLVPLPPERNIFRCRWVHRIKRYKARQVSKGLHHIHKYFYIFTKTFSEKKFQNFVGSSWSEEHSSLAASFSSFDALSFEGGFCSHVVFPLSSFLFSVH
jgi:hypothetical protein